jgi:hypothetical protein
LDLLTAIELFNSHRAHPLSPGDVEQITRIAGALGLEEFTVIESGAYLRDKASTIHINPGFVVSRLMVEGMKPDDIYAQSGYTYRLWLSGEAKQRKGETVSQKLSCPLCAGLPGDDHHLEECPSHPHQTALR